MTIIFNLFLLIVIASIFDFFILLVALKLFYIMYLETFATTSNKTADLFGMPKESLENMNVQTLFKNQGIYNGLLGLALLYARYIVADGLVLVRFLLIFILLTVAYRAYLSTKPILLKQGNLALITLILSFIPFLARKWY